MQLKIVRWGLLFSIITILSGFLLGGSFGLMEETLKDYLKDQGQQVLSQVYVNDTAKMDKIVSKSWIYFKRAHMHAGGIGSSVLALCIVLAGLKGRDNIRRIISSGMGIGAIGYSLFWLLAGMRAPALGSTDLAKESLKWLAIPSAGLLIMGVLGTLLIAFVTLWSKEQVTTLD